MHPRGPAYSQGNLLLPATSRSGNLIFYVIYLLTRTNKNLLYWQEILYKQDIRNNRLIFGHFCCYLQKTLCLGMKIFVDLLRLFFLYLYFIIYTGRSSLLMLAKQHTLANKQMQSGTVLHVRLKRNHCGEYNFPLGTYIHHLLKMLDK